MLPARQTLVISLQFGLLLGFALAHLDIAARIAAQKILWHEVHLALTVALIVCLPASLLLGLYFVIIGRINKRPLTLEQTRRLLYLISASVVVITCIGIISASFRLSLLRGAVSASQKWLFVSQPALTLLLIFGLRSFSDEKYAIQRRVTGQYVFFAVFFTIGILGTDIAQYYGGSLKPPPPKPSLQAPLPPNVVVITLDTVRADYLTPYNPELNTTPHLQELSEKALVFEDAQSVTSWTLPSHASLFTGKYIHRHGATGLQQFLRSSEVTLAEVLGSHGYDTAGFVGGAYCKEKFGIGQGFDLYRDRLDFFEFKHTYDLFSARRVVDSVLPDFWRTILGSDGERIAPEINKEVFKWLEKPGRAERPFLLFINYFDAHHPYDLGVNYRPEFGATNQMSAERANDLVYNYQHGLKQRYQKLELPQEKQEFIRGIYKAELKYLDDHLGELMHQLELLNFMDNTIIVVTSDHGEEFFDHGGLSHSVTLFQEVLHIPLVIYFPQRLRPSRVRQQVSLIDIMPTILDLTNVPGPTDIDGKSLIPMVTELKQNTHPVLLSELYPNAQKSKLSAISTSDWKYIEATPEQGRVKNSLFNRKEDLLEQSNVIGQEQSVAKQLDTTVDNLLKK